MKATRTEIASAVALTLAALAAQAQAQTQATPSAQNLDTVTITGIRASIAKSIDTKRNADTNVEVVSAEDVGKMPDKNIADALSRLAGVNVQYGGAGAMDEAERVSIRGTSPNLNLITVNGHALSSGDWHVGDQQGSGRSVGFGLMPSQLIGQSIVYKSGRADVTEGGISGSVDILTRKPLDFKKGATGEVSIGAVHASLPGTTDPQLSGLINWKNDDGTLGVLVQAFKENRHLRRDGEEVFSYSVVTPAQATASGDATLANKRYPGSLNAAEFVGVRERTGGYIGLQAKPSQALEVSLSAFRANLTADNYNSSGFAFPGQLVSNGWLIKNAKVSGDIITSADIVRPAFIAGNSAAAQADLNKRVIGFEYDNIAREGAKSLSSFTDLDVTFRPADRWSVRARLGYTVGSGITGSEPMLTYGLINNNVSYNVYGSRPTSYTVTDLTGKNIDLSKISNFSQMSNTAAAVESLDQEHYFHLDGEYKADWGAFNNIKFGYRKATHDRTYNVYSGRWNAQDNAAGAVTPSPFISVTGGLLVNKDTLPVYSNGTLTTQPVTQANLVPGQLAPATLYPANWGEGLRDGIPYNLFRFDASQIRAFADQYMNWDPVLNKTWTSGYFIEESNSSAYLMGEFESGKLSGNVGVRLAKTELTSISYQALTSGTAAGQCVPLQPCNVPNAIVGSRFATYIPQAVKTTNNSVLPSLNLRWEMDRDLIVRAALSRTLGRPNYNELAGAVTLNGTTLTGSSGNPLLKPITSNNLDLNAAWYFAPRAYVSGGLFMQNLQNYVKAGTSQVEYFNTVTGQNAIFTVSSRRGVGATLRGAETALEMPIGNTGFGFGANATYVDSQDDDGVEMLGTSKWTYNLRGFYEDDRFSVSLAWNHRSDYSTGFAGNGTNVPTYGTDGTATYNGLTKYAGYGALSLSVGYKLTKDLSLQFDGNNLNDPIRHTYSITESAPLSWYRSGRQYYLSLRAKF